MTRSRTKIHLGQALTPDYFYRRLAPREAYLSAIHNAAILQSKSPLCVPCVTTSCQNDTGVVNEPLAIVDGALATMWTSKPWVRALGRKAERRALVVSEESPRARGASGVESNEMWQGHE